MGSIIRKFREIRAALRYSVLDSSTDIDMLLLAKDLNAAVVSQDLGIHRWSEVYEIPVVPGDDKRVYGALENGENVGGGVRGRQDNIHEGDYYAITYIS